MPDSKRVARRALLKGALGASALAASTPAARAEPRLPGHLEPGGLATPEDFGALGDGVTDDFPAINAACQALIASGKSWVLQFGPRPYRVSNEIDLTAATAPYELRGVREQTQILPDAFGPTKACFRHASKMPFTQIGFEFRAATTLKNHPIGIMMRESGRATLRDISSGDLGNTVLFSTRPFNADWQNLDLFFCGWQPLHKDVTTGPRGITLSTLADSPVVTASAPVFDAGDVDQSILIHHDAEANEAIIATVITYMTPTQVTLSRPMRADLSGLRFSFGPVTARVTGDVVTFTRDIGLEAADVGRMIYIDSAAAHGRTLVTRIASVTSGGACVLEVAAEFDGNWRVFFTPTIYLGQHDVQTEGTTGPNDIMIDKCLVEGFKGPGILVDGGLHIKFGELKTHGRAWGEFSGFGASAEALIWNGAHKSRIEAWALEFCGKSVTGGVVRMAGDAPGLSIGYLSQNAPLVGGYMFDINVTDVQRAALVLPEINGRANLDRFDGLVRAGSAAMARRVFGSGRIGGASPAVEASVQWPQVIGAARSISPALIDNDASFTFRPASEAGFLFVTPDDAGGFWGVFKFNTVGIVLVVGSSAGVELDVPDSLNVDFSDSVLTIQNRSGAERRFHASVLG
jgi:hypothetical protein